MRWRRRSLPSLSSFLFSFSLLGGKRETTLIQILSQGRSRGRRGEMGCRESKEERDLAQRKIREINQPRRRGMEIIILLSPLLSLPPLASSSSTPTLPLLHLSLRFRKFAFYIAHSPPSHRCQKAPFPSSSSDAVAT